MILKRSITLSAVTPICCIGFSALLAHNNEDPLREPYFSRAFLEFGGVLPDDWRRIARVVDLTGLVECLTHDYIPDDVAFEILQLIESTLESCTL